VTDPARDAVEVELLRLGGGDPFDDVLRASDAHRERHDGCRLYPAGPRVMSLAAQVVRTATPMRILDLGSGLGYSTLWLAAAAAPDATVLGIERDGEHVVLAEQLLGRHRLDTDVTFAVGEVAKVLEELDGAFDFIHDDAWFASRPAHFERVLSLLRPGDVLTMPNWFLLEDALSERPRRDWARFAGPDWREAVLDLATALAREPRLQPLWVTQPPLLVAVRR
jgi:predicted O-methyltransferase YrrM